MRSVIDFLVNVDLPRLAAEPPVLVAAAVLFGLAVLFRWKAVLLVLFAGGAVTALLRYAKTAEGGAEMGREMYILAGGTLAVAVVLIYFLLVRGD